MKDQMEMLKDIIELHSCASFDEYNSLYCRVFAKWCIDYNEFAYYFEQQWNTGTDFTNWKVFSCKPGVCTTNNALIIVAIHCLHYLILLWRPSLWTYLEKLCMDVRFFTPSIHLIGYPLPMPIALQQIIMSYWYNAQW
jgi:hypothetical protein